LIENGDKASQREKKALAKSLGVKVEDVSWPDNESNFLKAEN